MTPEQREALGLLVKLADFVAAGSTAPNDALSAVLQVVLDRFAERMYETPAQMQTRLHWAADLAQQVAGERGEGVTSVRYADGTVLCGPCHHGDHAGCTGKAATSSALYDCECDDTSHASSVRQTPPEALAAERASAAADQRGLAFDQYQALAERTAGTPEPQARKAMVGLGIAGEAGEVADLVKKELYHGHAPDPAKIADELGDVLWYVAICSSVYGLRLSEVAQGNVDKLRSRYPEGFDPLRSQNRTGEIA